MINNLNLTNKSILITGGTGSLGKALTQHILTKHPNVQKLVILSRDEQKQFQMAQEFSDKLFPQIRYFLGDVRDQDRLVRAFQGIDIVIHAAAMKHVHLAEYNPDECIKTNIGGAQNVIHAALQTSVSNVVALSTDKACAPINLYGATKLTADKLFIAANNYGFKYGTTCSVVRYGNVMGSRGSVIPYFKDLADQGKSLPITDLRMTRFWISLEQAVKFVIDSLEMMEGGELYVPRIPSMKIIDLARAVSPKSTLEEIGMRPGEKLHEEMISSDDSRRTIILKDRFVVTPVVAEWGYNPPKGVAMAEGLAYKSDSNEQWMTESDIKKFIEKLDK